MILVAVVVLVILAILVMVALKELEVVVEVTVEEIVLFPQISHHHHHNHRIFPIVLNQLLSLSSLNWKPAVQVSPFQLTLKEEVVTMKVALVLFLPMLRRQLKYSFCLKEEENRRPQTTVVAHQHHLLKSTNLMIFLKIQMVEQEQGKWQGKFEMQCYCKHNNGNWPTADKQKFFSFNFFKLFKNF